MRGAMRKEKFIFKIIKNRSAIRKIKKQKQEPSLGEKTKKIDFLT